jgi:chaperone BCS1
VNVSDTLNELIAFARSNQIFGGIAAAGGFASAVYWLREIPARILRTVIWAFSTRIEISNDSSAFEPFVAWLEAHGTSWHARAFKLSTHGSALVTDDGENCAWTVAPGVGTHLIWYRGRPCWVSRWVNERAGSQGLRRRESIAIRMPGLSRAPLDRLIEEVKRSAELPGRLTVSVWTAGYWQAVRCCDARDLDTIVLGPGFKERLVADLEWFRSNRAWYRHRGLPWRRGYLFAGTPGTGKSSLAVALAGKFEMPVCMLNLGSVGTDDSLIEAICNVPSSALLLIEDIDTARVSDTRGKEEGQKANLVTLGALLNALDGAISREGRVLIMTTNHAERIDPALLRPGRVDVRMDFPKAGPAEIAEMYRRFFDGRRLDVPGGLSLSPAEVQGICLQHADDPDAAARRLLRGAVHLVETGAVA